MEPRFRPLDRIRHVEYPDLLGEIIIATPHMLVIQLDDGSTTEGEPNCWELDTKTPQLDIKRKRRT